MRGNLRVCPQLFQLFELGPTDFSNLQQRLNVVSYRPEAARRIIAIADVQRRFQQSADLAHLHRVNLSPCFAGLDFIVFLLAFRLCVPQVVAHL